jgi:hypothetical protein
LVKTRAGKRSLACSIKAKSVSDECKLNRRVTHRQISKRIERPGAPLVQRFDQTMGVIVHRALNCVDTHQTRIRPVTQQICEPLPIYPAQSLLRNPAQ